MGAGAHIQYDLDLYNRTIERDVSMHSVRARLRIMRVRTARVMRKRFQCAHGPGVCAAELLFVYDSLGQCQQRVYSWLRSRRRRIHCLILNYRVTGGYKEITAACSEHGTSSMFPSQTMVNNGGRLLIGIVQVQFESRRGEEDAAPPFLSISWPESALHVRSGRQYN